MNPSPPHSENRAGRLHALLAAGRFGETLDEFRRFEGVVPPDAELIAATAATRLGELEQGTALARAALERFRARGDDDGRMRACNLLGVIEFERGNLDRAERCFDEAFDLARILQDTLMLARASNNLASLADLRGDSQKALALFRAALLSYQRLGDRRGTAESCHNLGIVFRQLGEWQEAESSAAQAIRHAERLNERSLMSIVVIGRAEIDLRRGELAMARRELGRAGALAEEAGDQLGLIEVSLLRAQLLLAEGQAESAATEAENARTAAEAARAAVLQAQCAAVASRALKQLGRIADATTRREEAQRMFRAQGATRRLEELETHWSGT